MKKFLSMVLAVVMTVSLFTFATTSAGASDYTDADQIQYNEAVDIISALGIMSGYANGTFGPTGGLTRGAAAKIICNMYIGPEAANRLPTNATTFSDVPSNHTFAGPIAYCYEQGFISGYSDGTFRPSDPLSGYAFMKMLLCALGYDQNIEAFVGSNWRINVATKAMDVGIDDNLDANYNPVDAINREQATLLAFNTLQADMVEYDNKSTPVETTTGGSIIINTGSNVARIRTWASSNNSNAGNIDRKTDGSTGRPIMQFAELKFSRLHKYGNESDDFGRPVVRWTLGNDEIGKYINQSDYIVKTYSSSKDLKDIYSDLGMSTDDNKASLYLDGEQVRWSVTGDVTDYNIRIGKNTSGSIESLVGNDTTLYPTGAGSADARKDKVGDGCKIEVFYDDDSLNDDGRIIICCTSYYPAEVDKVTAAKGSDPRKITLSCELAVADDFEKNNDDNRDFETTQFTEDDIVLFSYAKGEIQEVIPTTRLQGTISRYSQNNYVYLNGTKYDYAGQQVQVQSGHPAITTGDDYIIYLNSANQIVYVDDGEFRESTSGDSGYAFVRWMDSETLNSRDTNRARLLFTNGTQRTVDLYKDYYDDWDGKKNAVYTRLNSDGDINGGFIVSYNIASNGEYRLNTVDGSKWGYNKSSYADGANVINDRVLTGVTVLDDSSKEFSVDASTVFIVETSSGTFRTYTGTRNVPTITANTNTIVAAYTTSTSSSSPAARYVFVVGTKDTVTTSKDVTFIAAASASDFEDDGDDVYVTYNAVVKGTITQLRVQENVELDGDVSVLKVGSADSHEGYDKAWNSVILNSTEEDDGLIIGGSFESKSLDVYSAHGMKSARNGQIEVNTNDGDGKSVDGDKYDLASNVNAYYIDDDGNIRATNATSIGTDVEAWVFFTMDDDDYITNLFVCEDNS